MRKKRLTLSMDDKTIRMARKLAELNHTSVSAMFVRYVQAMGMKQKPACPIGPLTRRAIGIIRLPKGKTEREVLEEALMEKYGLK